jgi:hypothetical protein
MEFSLWVTHVDTGINDKGIIDYRNQQMTWTYFTVKYPINSDVGERCV